MYSFFIAPIYCAKARREAQSFRLTCEDSPSIEYMARYIAKVQQQYTQRGGVRPFGVSGMMAGFAADGSPQLFLTDPAGTYSSWKANAIGGRNEKAVTEFLEKNWVATLSQDEAVKLAVKALLEVLSRLTKFQNFPSHYHVLGRLLTPAVKIWKLLSCFEDSLSM